MRLTGLFKWLAAICLLIASVFASAQTFIRASAPNGTGWPEFDDAAALGRIIGYDGIAPDGGVNRFNEPAHILTPDNQINPEGFQAHYNATLHAFLLGYKYVLWRLQPDVPNNQRWADRYTGGKVWPYRNFPGVYADGSINRNAWNAPVRVYQGIIDASRRAAIGAGKDPSTSVWFVLSNELCKGGVGNAKQNDGKLAPFYSGRPNGWAHPEQIKMVRKLRAGVTLGGSPTWFTSLENAAGKDGDVEIAAWSDTNPVDARWLSDWTQGPAMNCYAADGDPVRYAQKISSSINRIKSSGIFYRWNQNSRPIITEGGLFFERVQNEMDPAPERLAILKAGMTHPSIAGFGWFCLFAKTGDYGQERCATATRIGPGVWSPIGSTFVGPKYLP